MMIRTTLVQNGSLEHQTALDHRIRATGLSTKIAPWRM